MADNALILYPTDPNYEIRDYAEFLERLHNVGFLGHEYDYDKTQFWQGEKFFEYIEFSRSHKIAMLDNVNGELKQVNEVNSRDHCHIAVKDHGEETEILGVLNSYSVPPLCTGCGIRISEWVNELGGWYENKEKYLFSCPICNKASKIYELDWLKGLGFARCSIEIRHIWRGEAHPSVELLTLLKEETEMDWIYLYFRF